MIREFNVTYDDFEVGEIIDPDHFDINFADIAIRMNQIISTLNQITDGIGGSGASIINIGDIDPFTPENLQDYLEKLSNRLQSRMEPSGASFIGSSPIEGLSSTTVQGQLNEIASIIQEVDERLSGRINTLTNNLNETNLNVDSVTSRVLALETGLDSMESRKANLLDVYTRSQTDDLINQLESRIHRDFYSAEQVDELLDDKLDVTGDFVGTWNGVDMEDMTHVLGVYGMVVSPTQPSNPTERLLWFNPTNNQYTIYLNGQWRVNGTPMRIVKKERSVLLDADTTSVPIGIEGFDFEFDSLMVFKNTVFAKEGRDYTISPDGKSILGDFSAGTMIDFVAHVSTPGA